MEFMANIGTTKVSKEYVKLTVEQFEFKIMDLGAWDVDNGNNTSGMDLMIHVVEDI